MPKIVDHQQRREELAAALWRVIVRVGVDGASVRAVAEEAGWSPGAIRHYFSSQDELLRFGVELQLQRVPERIQTHQQLPAGIDRVTAILEELLPLDDARLAEAQIWLSALTRSRIDDALDDIRRTAFAGERYLCRVCVCDLIGRQWPDRFDDPLPEPLEAAAQELQTVVDGLTVNGANSPDLCGPSTIRETLHGHVERLRTRLNVERGGHSRA